MIKREDETKLDLLVASLPAKYRYVYKRSLMAGRWYHSYGVLFPDGAMEVQYTKSLGDGKWPDEYFGGVEIHYKNAPDYMSHKEANHKYCDYIGGPCWHDGSSLAFDQFRGMPDNEHFIYLYLIERGEETFGDRGFE